MDKLVLFNSERLKSLLNKRPKETKFGEHISLLESVSNIYEQLQGLDVEFVIVGLPEDVGVFANYGKSGTSGAFDSAIKILLNIQSNPFTHAKKVLILGHLDFSSALNKLKKLDQNKKKDITKARALVDEIDKDVTILIHEIIKSGKKPILIGGGHNNAYGNLKGAALALNSPVNVVNFDAHTDFRPEEGRHSGNGFSYAYAEGFLKRYFAFGIHENYTSDSILKTFKKIKSIAYNTYESMAIRKSNSFKSELNRALEHVSNGPFGIEFDCDAIQDVSSSAMTPSGFNVDQARRFVDFFARHPKNLYLHICEASPSPQNDAQVGKLVSYLITDYIRAHEL